MGNFTTILPLILLIAIMYFLLIRPQKKREKDVNTMRNAIKVGDEVITIGGICGKIVKTKDEVLTIQVGADKTKFEIMRWAVSKVVTESPASAAKKPQKTEKEEPADEADGIDVEETTDEGDGANTSLPKRLKKKSAEEEAGLEEK
ncbi:MAG: preprotein translocase subunit YajC [Clostridiales Family XIII bacterium]|jgi:preprotein translocase subunit YajC|nr:preprotein translocase subunit YajC [Clostridiales Family XIII bacterium]